MPHRKVTRPLQALASKVLKSACSEETIKSVTVLQPSAVQHSSQTPLAGRFKLFRFLKEDQSYSGSGVEGQGSAAG